MREVERAERYLCRGACGVGEVLKVLAVEQGQDRIEQGQDRTGSAWPRYLPLILHAVDRVRAASWSTIPHQGVFKVAGLEFHVLKETSCVLGSVSCRRREQGEPVGL